MHRHTKLSFVDEFRWVSPLRYLKNRWQNAVLLWCMLQAGPPALHYYCAVVLHSCTVLPPVCHSSNHHCHCCQQSSCVSNCYRTLRVFIWLSLVCTEIHFYLRYLVYQSGQLKLFICYLISLFILNVLLTGCTELRTSVKKNTNSTIGSTIISYWACNPTILNLSFFNNR